MFDFADYTAVHWWRFCYSIVSIVVTLLVINLLRYRILMMRPSQLYGAFTLLGYMVASTVSALESLYRDDPLSLRTPIYTATLMFSILAIVAGYKEKSVRDKEIDDLAQSMVKHLEQEDEKHDSS